MRSPDQLYPPANSRFYTESKNGRHSVIWRQYSWFRGKNWKETFVERQNCNEKLQVDQLRGGVCGGSLIHGVLKLDQEIEIRPGVSRREEDSQNEVVTPIRTKIMSLMSDKNSLQVQNPTL